MKLRTSLGIFLTLLLGVMGCRRETNAACFDNPDRFVSDLKESAIASLKPGAKLEQAERFCTERHLTIVHSGSTIYCTAEAHRGLSRCDASLSIEFGQGGELKTITATQPTIKNP